MAKTIVEYKDDERDSVRRRCVPGESFHFGLGMAENKKKRRRLTNQPRWKLSLFRFDDPSSRSSKISGGTKNMNGGVTLWIQKGGDDAKVAA